MKDWLKGQLKEWAMELLDESNLKQHGILNYKKVSKLWNEHLDGQRDWSNKIWIILMFQAWISNEKLDALVMNLPKFLFLPKLSSGGAERVIIDIANNLSKRGYCIDIVLAKGGDIYLEEISPSVNIINLKSKSTILSFFPLSRYLKKSRPYGIISALSHANCAALLAGNITDKNIKIVVSERNISYRKTTNKIGLKRIVLDWLIKYFYPQARCIVTVSEGVRKSIISTYKFKDDQVKCIFSSIDFKKINKLKSENILNTEILMI